RMEIAKSDREQWLDRAAWSQRMVQKKYLSKSQAESDQARLESAEITLKKNETELKILEKFSFTRTITALMSKIEKAPRTLLRVQTEADSKLEQAVVDLTSKTSIHYQEEAKRTEIKDQIEKCRISSPQDGLVVYNQPEQSRFGTGSRQSIIAQGESVYE